MMTQAVLSNGHQRQESQTSTPRGAFASVGYVAIEPFVWRSEGTIFWVLTRFWFSEQLSCIGCVPPHHGPSHNAAATCNALYTLEVRAEGDQANMILGCSLSLHCHDVSKGNLTAA